ncbi:transglutaminase-like domain-containing protein [uncultured Tenacibaculum sp.]|uniref:transglutaminase-like domain-containing protein n=1 Tax=uncultured Tenacibaculum sp. TaxID=174713 RepID=UPI0026260D45|nr:transglutaminase-like domain-containing protein [uncultured Tenacibaculum sp.]
MDITTINNSLYREVLRHTKYDKYFDVTPCKATYVGDYTTTGGLEQMVNVALEFKSFSKKIAPKLKGKTISETVNNIYNFLYNHVQYQADGFHQTLKTPSCVWSSRFSGTDCKSYSVFASTILLNLNIDHSFRKVTQPSQPNRWSHVYVVIHSNGKTFIIDPTKKVNTQVTYIQKEDMKVQDRKLPYSVLHGDLSESTNEQQNISHDTILNFRFFLQDLNSYGVSKAVTQKIENEVRKSTDNRINPVIDLKPSYIKVNQTIIHYGVSLPKPEMPEGLGFVDLNQAAGIFSSLFGPEDRASVLAKADALARMDINRAMSIANSQGKAAAISFLDKQIATNRSLAVRYKSANSKAKHTKIANDLEDFKNNKLFGNQSVATTNNTPTPTKNTPVPTNHPTTTTVKPSSNNSQPPGKPEEDKMSLGKVVAITGVGIVSAVALTYAVTKNSNSNSNK